MIDQLPQVNASLNAVAFAFMLAGFGAIKMASSRQWHKIFMLCAVGASTAFLASYLTYHFNADSKAYTGAIPYFYYPMLISHIVLAAAVPILVGYLLFLAYQQKFDRHKKVAKWTFPIWAYVSVTGVLIFYFVHVP